MVKVVKATHSFKKTQLLILLSIKNHYFNLSTLLVSMTPLYKTSLNQIKKN
jgi:hypothetical protein